jgi:3-keto-5-aminohexanoate cleavage enzyme
MASGTSSTNDISTSISTSPVIIEAAINGATPKSRNPHVPISSAELAEDALACFAAGAAIVHLHCNPIGGPDDEVAERYLEAFRPVWAERPDALIYPTVNFSADGLSFGHLPRLAKEGLRVGLLDPGSLNFGRREDDGTLSGSFVYANSFDRIGEIFALHEELQLGPSLAIYEPGFLRATLAWHRAGRLPAGSMVKLYLSTEQGLTGAPFGLPVTATALEAYLELLDGTGLPWAVSAVGGDIGRSDVARLALRRGGHLHLGLEFYGDPTGSGRTPTNLELVTEAATVCAEEGRPVASCADAARILGLPGQPVGR